MKVFCLLALALFISSALALSEEEYQKAFRVWTSKFSKAYTNDEFVVRYNIFKANLDYVNNWNAGNSTTVLGTTAFADLTNEEYRRIYLGTRFDGIFRIGSAGSSRGASALPDSVDWVTKGAVTAVKNQGQCGSCWSFSTTGSTEGAHFLATKNLVSLSEQNLMDCSKSFGNDACNGGLMDNAFKYIIANKGIDTEASYPYTMAAEDCKYSAANLGATISKYTDVTSGSESALQEAAVQQPISVAIDAGQSSFQLYTSGVYNEPLCSPTSLDHGVLVVGYGTDATTDTAYWLVKNSWGPDWGIQGYIWMSRNKNNQCGIATMASYPTV